MRKSIVWGAFAACLGATAAFAAASKGMPPGNGFGGKGEVILIAQIALLLLVGRGLGEVMQRFGQPAVIGQLLAGLILGPSFFGWIWPHAHHQIFPSSPEQRSLISGLSDVGIMMLLLLTGMETDLKLVRRVGTPAVAVMVAGIAVPFFCGFTLGELLPASILPGGQTRLIASLFLGTALSISSIKIVAMVVREMNFMRRNLGQIIVASAIMEDTAGWIIISITLGIAGAGTFAWVPFAKTVIGTALFLVLSYTVGRRLVFWLIRWVNDSFVSNYAVVTAILIVMCVLALVTQGIGVNTVLGSFVAGVLIGESPILSQHIEDQLRGLITAFMMPIFFGLSGLSADLTILKNPTLALLTLGLIAIASVGKFGGAFAGGKMSGLSTAESLALGCGMNARGSTEVIVATIGLTMGALTQNLYTMIVTMAITTTMAMPPMLRWALGRLPMHKEEKERLEKEEIDARGFVSRFERLLIAADKSANGRFASRVAGFIAGKRGIPITVLEIAPNAKKGEAREMKPAILEAATTEGAKAGHRAAKEDVDESTPERAEVSSRVERNVSKGMAREAGKGYDLLFVGVDRMQDSDGNFSAALNRIVADFDAPLALAIAGREGDAIETKSFNILVPVNGTEASRRGAELAFAGVSPKESKVVAVHVGERASNGKSAKTRSRRLRKTQDALLGDIAALAGRYGYDEIETVVHRGGSPDEAIIDEAKQADTNLIVIGVNRRVGDTLSLGQTVASVMRQWNGAILLLAV